MSDLRFFLRLAAITAAASVIAIAWNAGPRLFLPPPEPVDITVTDSGEQALIETFEARRESVVFISTSETLRNPFTRLSREVERGTGSGFVWDDRGHVVTNWHVLEGATRAFVRLADGRVEQARLVGASPEHDLAVLRVPGLDAAPIPLAQGPLAVGQTALAIGNPFGLDWTLTTGIVSALDRELPSPRGRGLTGLIQTDAAINPGNSGGPLLDASGRLIGVTTAIFSPSGASAGIGFAVPVSTVTRVVPQLISRGRYAPPSLGIEFDERINALARRSGLTGVLVIDVTAGSAADSAGLAPARIEAGRIVPRDIVVAVDGTPIDTAEDLLGALDLRLPGEEVRVRLRRDGQDREVTLTLDPPA